MNLFSLSLFHRTTIKVGVHSYYTFSACHFHPFFSRTEISNSSTPEHAPHPLPITLVYTAAGSFVHS